MSKRNAAPPPAPPPTRSELLREMAAARRAFIEGQAIALKPNPVAALNAKREQLEIILAALTVELLEEILDELKRLP